MKIVIHKIYYLQFILQLICVLPLSAQETTVSQSYQDYFNKYSQVAIEEMLQYGIPASITLAQGAFESDCGRSKLAVEANNHFGIKCHEDWKGATYTMDDDEKNECFRKYDKPEDSFRDHSEFLISRPRYAFLFSLDADDYTGWARGLKTAGYATNPQYSEALIRIIEDNKLNLLDKTKAQLPIAGNKSRQPKTNEKNIVNPNEEASAEYQEINKSRFGRSVFINNDIPFIFAKEGDSFKSIASEFRIYAFQIVKYNDMENEDALNPGQFVYLEPKKRTGVQESYTIKSNENLWQVAQLFGIKLKKLATYNHLRINDTLTPGQVIQLSR